MSLMPDPLTILLSLQQALNDGISIDPSELDNGYKMFYDEPFNGGQRYSFAKIIDGNAQALSIFGLEDTINGLTCYNIGYAVKENFRGRGLAAEAVNKGLEKLKQELNLSGIRSFYIEAVIDITNIYSISVAERIFSRKGIPIKDRDTDTPALYFKKLIT